MSVTAIVELYRAGSPATSGLSAGHGRSARYPLSGLADGRVDGGPGRLVRGKLLPEVGHKLGELTVGHAVLEAGHVAEIARHWRSDAMQDYLDQIVRHGAVQVAVQCQRWPAAEQGRAADRMTNRAGALIEAGADGRGRDDPGGGRAFKLDGHHLLRRLTDRVLVE